MIIRADARALPLREGCVDCVETDPMTSYRINPLVCGVGCGEEFWIAHELWRMARANQKATFMRAVTTMCAINIDAKRRGGAGKPRKPYRKRM